LKTIPVERFEFFALYFPTDAWKKLADLCHLHPEKDLPQCPWFLPFCFGKELPSHLKMSDINENTVSQIVCKSKIDYCIIRKYKDSLTDEAKKRIVEYSNLDTVLWYAFGLTQLCVPYVDKFSWSLSSNFLGIFPELLK